MKPLVQKRSRELDSLHKISDDLIARDLPRLHAAAQRSSPHSSPPLLPRGFEMLTRIVAVALILALSSTGFAQTPPAGAPKELVVYPAEIKFTAPRDEQRLVVLGVWADGHKADLTRTASLTSANPKIAAAEKGIVRTAGDGNTTVTVEAAGAKASVPVSVQKATADIPVNFATEIIPVLTKSGCNSGACHGAALGRGGFRLSLFGFDPSFDYAQIVQSNKGRRIVPNEPERSE